ncbi:MAG: hypothetical protein GY953_36925 [bacterium]|nr:hypothetical protein [bacterium]
MPIELGSIALAKPLVAFSIHAANDPATSPREVCDVGDTSLREGAVAVLAGPWVRTHDG